MKRGRGKVQKAWETVRKASAYAFSGSFWESAKKAGLKEREIKNALILLEGAGEITIKRSRDGRRLYVLTLRELKKNPVRLDRWIIIR